LEEAVQKQTPIYLTSREPTPEQSVARHEMSGMISRALAKLPNNLRMPYMLHAVSGVPVAEVADKLGLSISATKSRIFRARCALQSRLHVSCGPARCSPQVFAG
jgi:RNA polymerase sigma-70 factor (ECF subfamily)